MDFTDAGGYEDSNKKSRHEKKKPFLFISLGWKIKQGGQ